MNEIEYMRSKLSVTQRELANMIGTSRSSVAMTENGLRSLPFEACMRLGEIELIYEETKAFNPTDTEWMLLMASQDAVTSELEEKITVLDKQIEPLQAEIMRMQTDHNNYTKALQLIQLQQAEEDRSTLNQRKLKIDRAMIMNRWISTRPTMQRLKQAEYERLYAERETYRSLLDEMRQPGFNPFAHLISS